MSNLPKNLKPAIKAFRESDYTLRLFMYDGFVEPDEIAVEVWDRNKKKYEIVAAYDSGENLITATWTAAQLQDMGQINEYYVRFTSGSTITFPFGGEIKPTRNSGDNDSQGYNVTFSEGEYYVVEIIGMSLVTEQVGIATAKAIEAGARASEASASAIAAQDSETSAFASKEAAEDQADLAQDRATEATEQAALATAKAVLTAADRVQTGLDVIQTGQDKSATAADRFQTGQDAILTTANRVQTTADAISALSSKTAAATSEANAANSATAASVNSNVYATEALGRAAVADGATFLVTGTGDVSSYRYRRTNSTTSVLEATNPSLQAAASGVTALAKATTLEARFILVNLFDPTKGTDGFTLFSNGTTSASAVSGYSEYIPCIPGEVYSTWDGTTAATRVNFATSAKANISQLNSTNGDNTTTFTIPANAFFFRAVYTVARKATMQIEKSAAPTSFVVYGTVDTKNIRVTASAVGQSSAYRFVSDTEKSTWNAKIGADTMVLEASKNLFNPATATDGITLFSNGTSGASATSGVSAFIPTTPGETISYSDGLGIGAKKVNFYNAAQTSISQIVTGVNTTTFVIPALAVYIRVVYTLSQKAQVQVERASAPTLFAPFGDRIKSLSDKAIRPKGSEINQEDDYLLVKTSEKATWNDKIGKSDVVIQTGKNLFDPTKGTDGFYLNANGSASASGTYGYTDFITVVPGEVWTCWDGSTGARRVNFYNSSFVNQDVLAIDAPTTGIATFTIPAGVAYMKPTYWAARKSTTQIEKSATATTYEPYSKSISTVLGAKVGSSAADLIQDDDHRFVTTDDIQNWNSKTDYNANIVLPDVMYAVVGKEFNLYYDAFTLLPEYGQGTPNFLFDIVCSKGIMWRRSFRITPVSGDVGDFPFTFKLLDSDGNVLQSATSILRIVPANNPSTPKNILHIGDSTIDEGSVTKTLQQNLASLGGNVPVFLGQHHPAPFKNEARTGRTYGTYAVGGVAYKFFLTGLNPAMDISNIRDAYYSHNTSDNQVLLSERWKVNPDGTGWAIGYYFSQFIIPTSFPTVLNARPAALGAGFPATLNVTNAVTLNNFSIFKDNEGIGVLNFQYYRESVLGLDPSQKIDSLIMNLGINDIGSNVLPDSGVTTIADNAQLLVNAALADNSACKVVIEIPKSRGSDYFMTSRKHTNFRVSMHKLRKKLIERFDFNPSYPNVYLSQSGFSVDRFYGYPNSDQAPAARITTPVFRGTTDDVHPSVSGCQQEADGLTGCVLYALNL